MNLAETIVVELEKDELPFKDAKIYPDVDANFVFEVDRKSTLFRVKIESYVPILRKDGDIDATYLVLVSEKATNFCGIDPQELLSNTLSRFNYMVDRVKNSYLAPYTIKIVDRTFKPKVNDTILFKYKRDKVKEQIN